MKSRLLANTISLGLVQVANYIAPFIILVHLTKTLGLEIYGVLAFAQGIVAISFVLLDFGYSLSATNKISEKRNNKKYVAKVIGGIVVIKLFLYTILVLAIISYSIFTDKYSEHSHIFLISLFPIAMQGLAPLWFFHGIEKMKFFAISAIVAKVFFAWSAVVFVKSPGDYHFVPLLNGVGQMLALMGSIYFIYRLGYRIQFPSVRIVAYCFGFSRHFFASRVAVASYMNGAIIILGLFAQPAVVAIYSMAEQLYKVMQSALSPVAAAAYPYMSKEKNSALMIKLIVAVVGLSLVGACIGYYTAPSLVEFVFDKNWLASIPVLNVFLVAIVVHAAAVMTGYPLAALVGRLEVANSSVMTGAMVYFILLALVFMLDLVTPVILAGVMLLSELCVFLHRSIVLLPAAFKDRHSISHQGKF